MSFVIDPLTESPLVAVLRSPSSDYECLLTRQQTLEMGF
jgi:hypothetical protein